MRVHKLRINLYRYYLDGSYTVEASLLMPIIIMVFITLLYMIFYLHDKYILHIYADRMAQECCWNYLENEGLKNPTGSQSIIDEVKEKYESEMNELLLMTKVVTSLGTCKKNILTHIYTVTWHIVGAPEYISGIGNFHIFQNIVYDTQYRRIHARKWIYGYDILNEKE